MRKNFGSQSWLYPMPVLMIGTYSEDGKANVMNAAWGGIWNDNQIAVCIDISHKTAANIQQRKAFTVSIGTAASVVACDYVGIVSGNDEPDKLAKAGFHVQKSAFVDAPVIEELPMTLECRLLHFDPETGCTTGEIVNICADESILDSDGRISPEKLDPISYDPVRHTYRRLGSIVGSAFHDGLQLKK